jgi:hypothetical protein
VWTNLIKHSPAAKLTMERKLRAVFSHRSAARLNRLSRPNPDSRLRQILTLGGCTKTAMLSHKNHESQIAKIKRQIGHYDVIAQNIFVAPEVSRMRSVKKLERLNLGVLLRWWPDRC